MAKEKLVLIKEANLANNCPECFHQGLTLLFYQKHRYGKLFHSVTGEISNQIRCNKCGSDVYPSKWTDDIERIFEYYQKMVSPEKTSLKFNTLFYVLMLVITALVAAIVFVLNQGVI
ncbi:MAG: hypothetical protein ACFCUL_10420 [Flavobacteriaceae bacterium]